MNRNTISTTEVLLTNTTAKLFNNQKIYNALYFVGKMIIIDIA